MEDRMSRTHSPAKLSLAIWFSALVLAFGAQDMSAATVTYIVGTCKSGTRFSTIQSALDASPAPNTVEVCPGISSEQVTISHPVTLEGITEGNGSLAQIELPSDYTVNASVIAGGRTEPAIAQVYVNDVSGGSVNLTNLNVNGVGFGTNDIIFIGVLYNQSSGTINQVTTSAQNTSGGATNVDGWGMWIQGGSSKPAVTVENSSVHDFSGGGILAVGETAAPDLTVTIKKNVVSSDAEGTNDIVVEEGTDPTVSGNIVSGVGDYGIIILASTGSITGNTFLGSQIGIELAADGASVTSNNIYGAVTYGIDVGATALKESTVEDNTIRTVKSPTSDDSDGIGIELHCNKISSSQVHSNTIMDSFDGYGDAPAGFTGSNTYVGLFFDVDNGSCAGGSVSGKANAVARPKLPGQSRGQ
jgi:parallel beta-helix repeat protein